MYNNETVYPSKRVSKLKNVGLDFFFSKKVFMIISGSNLINISGFNFCKYYNNMYANSGVDYNKKGFVTFMSN